MRDIDAIRAILNAYPEDRLDRETARALLDRLERAEARIKAVDKIVRRQERAFIPTITAREIRRALDA